MRWGFKGADNQIIIIETFKMNGFSSCGEMFSIIEVDSLLFNQFRLVCVWVCLSYDENAAHCHCTLCVTEMVFSFSSVICDLCSIQLTFSLLLFSIRLVFAYAFFLLNYDICVRHLCRFHFSNSFFFCRYFKKKST